MTQAMPLEQKNALLAPIREAFREQLREVDEAKIAKRVKAVPELIATQILDPKHPQCGGWGDITDCASRPLAWDGTSLHRLTWLVEAWSDPSCPYFKDPEVAPRINLAAKYYATVLLPEEPFPNNWWCWQIGFPRELAVIFLFGGEALDAEAHKSLLFAFRHLVDHVWDFHASANLMQVATSTLCYALSSGDDAYFQRVKEWAEASSEIVPDPIRNPQGYRRDGTYFFHGARVNLAYGIGHFIEFARASHYLATTPWRIGGKGMDNCVRTLLDFAQWTVFGNRVDPFILDRGLGTAEGDGFAQEVVSGLVGTALLLIKSNAPRREELEGLCTRLLSQGAKARRKETKDLADELKLRKAAPLQGARYYADAEYGLCQRVTWGASIKMATSRTCAYAGINRMNLRGWHISDGQIILRTTGEEYAESVIPTMDWERLSGITRADGFRLPHETHGHGWFSAGAESADGTTACCGLDFAIRRADDQMEIAARKSWYLLRDGIVALGSNIWTTAKVEMETIIRHVALPAEFEQATFEEGELETQFIVGHDCVYILPDKPKVRVYTQWREGKYEDLGSKPDVEKAYRRRYWTALISHGSGPHKCWGDPKTDGQYTIVYLPKTTLEQAKAWWAAQPFEVLQKDILAHRLYDRVADQTMTIRQWKGANVKAGRLAHS